MIAKAGAIPSSLHQKVKFIHEGHIIMIQSDWDVVSLQDDNKDMVPMSFDQYSSTLVLNMMRGMSYLPGYTPTEKDARYMARLRKDRITPHMEGIVCISEVVEVQDLQRTLRQMHLGIGILETPDVMIVAPPSPDRASMFSVCFPKAVFDYNILMDTVIDADGVTLPNAYTDEMDMIGVGRILDVVPHGPHSDFNLFGVFMIDYDDVTLYDPCTNVMDMIDDDDFVTIVTPDVFTVEGVSDSVDPPLSFNTMSRFVTLFDDVAGGNNNDMSVFKYSPVSLHFPLIVPRHPWHIYMILMM
ncbi:hypothetical protein CK203_116024 [Vitis vinifera]|uniref:Uncharacterized protein n=1 Tax=Vitis vinifera TaxID=29760 RepID=A0A438FEC6_VITVI|nr:hypothetical protein CK203_116024 [Vitis vinifera]